MTARTQPQLKIPAVKGVSFHSIPICLQRGTIHLRSTLPCEQYSIQLLFKVFRTRRSPRQDPDSSRKAGGTTFAFGLKSSRGQGISFRGWKKRTCRRIILRSLAAAEARKKTEGQRCKKLDSGPHQKPTLSPDFLRFLAQLFLPLV
jgi:hypothetical protein